MRAQAQQDMVDVFIICEHHTTFHGGYMVRKETTEATHKAERTGFPAVQLCAKRLTIVFYEGNPTCSGDFMYFPKIIWIAEKIDSEYQARSVADSCL